MMKLSIYIMGVLFVLLLPAVFSEGQILPQDLSISIHGFVNCSSARLNISINTPGGERLDIINDSECGDLNKDNIKTIKFIGNLGDCNQSVTAQMIQACNNYFNESCDGFPCQSSWLVCIDDLNKSKTTLNEYLNNTGDLGILVGNITMCNKDLSTANTNYQNCQSTSAINAKTIEDSKGKVDPIWLGVVGVGALVLGWFWWNKGKAIKNIFSKTNEMNFSGKRIVDGKIVEG